MRQWPERSDIAGVFLTIGPLGRGAFAIIDLGAMAKQVNLFQLSN